MTHTTEFLGSLSPEVAARFDEIGPIWGSDINGHRDFVIASYSPLVKRAPKDGVTLLRDLPYGPSPRQRLDVFCPCGPAARTGTVLMFFHGGAFIRGSKSIDGEIYDNVAYWFARQGILTLNVEYRLATEQAFPAGAQDVALAAAWAHQHLGTAGGGIERLFLMGHSAGGAHVASCLFDPAFAAHAPRVAGAILVSARLQADVLPDNPNAAGVAAYFGADPALYEARSAMTYAACSDVPLLVTIAEHENPYLDRYGIEFHRRARDARPGVDTRFMLARRHNHTSIVAHLNSGEETVGPAILDFIDAH